MTEGEHSILAFAEPAVDVELRVTIHQSVIARACKMWFARAQFFLSRVEILLIRHGERQRLETLINEEALLLAKYLREERKKWTPRIVNIKCTTLVRAKECSSKEGS